MVNISILVTDNCDSGNPYIKKILIFGFFLKAQDLDKSKNLKIPKYQLFYLNYFPLCRPTCLTETAISQLIYTQEKINLKKKIASTTSYLFI